ncbi:PAS domain-containing protein, partial [Flavobacterium sp.]|uniref:PAS domain-containing protein n=1 Tax=Flavobacterium sp. TaxID=239 RepID=UPI00262AEF3E
MEINTTNLSSLFYYNPQPSWIYEKNSYVVLDVNTAALARFGVSKDIFLSTLATSLIRQDQLTRYKSTHHDFQHNQDYIDFGLFDISSSNTNNYRAVLQGFSVKFQDKDCILVLCREHQIVEEKNIDLLNVDNLNEKSFAESRTKKYKKETVVTLKSKSNTSGYLLDLIPHLLAVTDLKGNFLQINAAGCSILGYEESELLM